MTTTSDTPVRPLEVVDVAERGPNDTKFYSVTTILKALHNPALEYWAIKETATAAIDSQGTWKAMLEDQGKAETVKWLCGARHRRPKLTLGADQLGTVVHRVCETYALSGEKPDREFCTNLVRAHAAPTVDVDVEVNLVGQMLNQFDRWLDRFQPEYTAAEQPVYSNQFGYAGSLDAILTLDGVRLITDYKTRREPLDSRGNAQTPYPESGLQLAGYRHADLAGVVQPRRTEEFKRRYYLLSTDEAAIAQPMPPVDGGLCIIITPRSCEAYPIKCDQEVFESFLYCLEVFRWNDDVARRVVGEALIAPGDQPGRS